MVIWPIGKEKKCNVLLCLEEDWYVSMMIIYNACLIISQRCKPLNSSWVVEMEKGMAFLYDMKVPLKLKGNFYQTTVRPTMLYGTRVSGCQDPT